MFACAIFSDHDMIPEFEVLTGIAVLCSTTIVTFLDKLGMVSSQQLLHSAPLRCLCCWSSEQTPAMRGTPPDVQQTLPSCT